jgi:hypothetical protein
MLKEKKTAPLFGRKKLITAIVFAIVALVAWPTWSTWASFDGSFIGGNLAQSNIFTDLFFRTGSDLGSNYINYTNGFRPNSSSGATGAAPLDTNTAAYTANGASIVNNCTAVVNPYLNFHTGCAVRITGTSGSTENSYACWEDGPEVNPVSPGTLYLSRRVGIESEWASTTMWALKRFWGRFP